MTICYIIGMCVVSHQAGYFFVLKKVFLSKNCIGNAEYVNFHLYVFISINEYQKYVYVYCRTTFLFSISNYYKI